MKASLFFAPNRWQSISLALATGLLVNTLPMLLAGEPTKAAAMTYHNPATLQLIGASEWKFPMEANDYVFDGLPLEEVSRTLRMKANERFDVLLPMDQANVPARIDATSGQASQEAVDYRNMPVFLRLKNATPVEVFRAMNMLFEIEHKPVRWELAMNGNRPTAMLRSHFPAGAVTLRSEKPAAASPSAPVNRSVFYVGALLKPSGPEREASWSSLRRTIAMAIQGTFRDSATCEVQHHTEAELLVVSGTEEEVKFVKEVVEALKEKAAREQQSSASKP